MVRSALFTCNCPPLSGEYYLCTLLLFHSSSKILSSISGRKEVYERRTIRSNCRNGLRYVRKISVENCECARSDYICDFGFRKDAAWTESCVKNPDFGHDPYAVPSDCKPGRFYNRTRGYVKIRGDTCAGGRAKVGRHNNR